MTQPDLSHLEAAAARLAMASSEIRLSAISDGIFINHDVAVNIFKRMEYRLQPTGPAHKPHLLIIGAAGSGKTTLRKRFEALYAGCEDGDGRMANYPVVSFDIPAVPNIGSLYNALLTAIGIQALQGRIEERERCVYTNLRVLGTQIILIDEVHNGLRMGRQGRRQFMNALKSIGNVTGVRIIAFGTPEATELFREDQQIVRRFECVSIPRLKPGRFSANLLIGFERNLPLRRPSALSSLELANYIFEKCNGTIARLADVLITAAEVAIRSGAECITKDVLDMVDIRDISDDIWGLTS